MAWACSIPLGSTGNCVSYLAKAGRTASSANERVARATTLEPILMNGLDVSGCGESFTMIPDVFDVHDMCWNRSQLSTR